MIYDLELEEGRFNHSAGADNSLLTTSLDHWSGLTCNDTQSCPNSCRGFSRGATAVMSALMGRPEAARGNLTNLLNQVITPNGMCAYTSHLQLRVTSHLFSDRFRVVQTAKV